MYLQVYCQTNKYWNLHYDLKKLDFVQKLRMNKAAPLYQQVKWNQTGFI